MFSKPFPLQILTTDPFKPSLLPSMHISGLTRLFARLLFQGLSARLLQWVRVYLHTHLLKTVPYISTDICSQKTSWCAKSSGYFRNRRKWKSQAHILSNTAGIHHVFSLHPSLGYLILSYNASYSLLSILLSPFETCLGWSCAGTWASASRSTSAIQGPGSGSFLLLRTNNYYTSAAVANSQLFPGKCCWELEVQSKRLILQGYALGNLLFFWNII